MMVHINSLNHILYDFIINEALPKYSNIWRANGESNISVDGKLFMLTATAKLFLKQDISSKFPLVNTLTDSNGNLDMDSLKEILLDTYNEFSNKGKKLVIPFIDWEVDSEDIHKIYDISKNYKVKD